MTTKTTKTNAILTSIMLAVGISMIPSAFSIEYPFLNGDGTHDVCIISSDFNGVKLNGNTNQGSTIAPLVENGMDEVGDNTNMSLTKITSCSSGKSVAYGSWLSSSYLGSTQGPFGSTGNQYKYVKFNTNSAVNFANSGSCQWYQNPNLEYVANHEFGHFAGLDLAHGSPSSPTMNEASCGSAYASIKTNDINKINGWYN